VYDPHALRFLIDTVGLTQVVAGTDYPFDMGDYDLARLVSNVPGLEDAGQAAILSGNARKLLGLVPAIS
jgi:aminocarboxymuconate-semialdehyde decarboxylase